MYLKQTAKCFSVNSTFFFVGGKAWKDQLCVYKNIFLQNHTGPLNLVMPETRKEDLLMVISFLYTGVSTIEVSKVIKNILVIIPHIYRLEGCRLWRRSLSHSACPAWCWPSRRWSTRRARRTRTCSGRATKWSRLQTSNQRPPQHPCQADSKHIKDWRPPRLQHILRGGPPPPSTRCPRTAGLCRLSPAPTRGLCHQLKKNQQKSWN